MLGVVGDYRSLWKITHQSLGDSFGRFTLNFVRPDGTISRKIRCLALLPPRDKTSTAVQSTHEAGDFLPPVGPVNGVQLLPEASGLTYDIPRHDMKPITSGFTRERECVDGLQQKPAITLTSTRTGWKS